MRRRQIDLITTTLDLITTTQAAALLGVSPVRVRQLVASGRLPVIRIGDRCLVRQIDLDPLRARIGTRGRIRGGRIPTEHTLSRKGKRKK